MAGRVIWDLGAADSPAWEPELGLGVEAAGILLVQTSEEDKAEDRLPLTLVGGNGLHPGFSSPIGGSYQYEGFSCGKAMGECPASSVAATCRAQEPCLLALLGRGF